MYKLKLLYYVVLLLTIGADCYSFDDYQANTAAILDLLSKEDSNKHLINTVVDCMGKTFTSNGKSNDFLRCVNDLMHTDDLTNTDDIRFIIGNYAARASKLLVKCYIKKDDLIYCLRAFGDCLPLLFRGLFGYDVHKRNCRRLLNLPKYDKDDDYYREDEEELDEYEYDDEYDGYDEYDDYDDMYDYDEESETDEDDMDGMITDRKKARKEGTSIGSGSRGPSEKTEAAAAASASSEFSPATSQIKSTSEELKAQSTSDPDLGDNKASESDDSIEVISDQE